MPKRGTARRSGDRAVRQQEEVVATAAAADGHPSEGAEERPISSSANDERQPPIATPAAPPVAPDDDSPQTKPDLRTTEAAIHTTPVRLLTQPGGEDGTLADGIMPSPDDGALSSIIDDATTGGRVSTATGCTALTDTPARTHSYTGTPTSTPVDDALLPRPLDAIGETAPDTLTSRCAANQTIPPLPQVALKVSRDNLETRQLPSTTAAVRAIVCLCTWTRILLMAATVHVAAWCALVVVPWVAKNLPDAHKSLVKTFKELRFKHLPQLAAGLTELVNQVPRGATDVIASVAAHADEHWVPLLMKAASVSPSSCTGELQCRRDDGTPSRWINTSFIVEWCQAEYAHQLRFASEAYAAEERRKK